MVVLVSSVINVGLSNVRTRAVNTSAVAQPANVEVVGNLEDKNLFR
jgi:hypothetical protein